MVGQQITLADNNATTVGPRITLLINQGQAGNADLVVKGIVNGEARGWHRNTSGLFASDRDGEAALSDTALRALAQVPGQALSYTAVPPGSGVRIGIDRDEDTLLDNDDNCPMVGDPDQTDTDNDGAGNSCDEDDDDDGLSDLFESSLGTNALLADTDGDGFGDGVELSVGTNANNPAGPWPPADGDLAPVGVYDGLVNMADYLVGQGMALGLMPQTALDIAHGDLQPTGISAGFIDTADVLLILQQVLNGP